MQLCFMTKRMHSEWGSVSQTDCKTAAAEFLLQCYPSLVSGLVWASVQSKTLRQDKPKTLVWTPGPTSSTTLVWSHTLMFPLMIYIARAQQLASAHRSRIAASSLWFLCRQSCLQRSDGDQIADAERKNKSMMVPQQISCEIRRLPSHPAATRRDWRWTWSVRQTLGRVR